MSVEQFTSEPLPSGRYATSEFEPALSFTVPKGDRWRLSWPDSSDVFEISPAKSLVGAYSSLTFVRVQEVFAPDSQDLIPLSPTDRTTSAPKDMVTWLRNHPLLDTSKPVPVTVGGQEGVRLDTSVSPAPEEYAPTCKDPCLFTPEVFRSRERVGALCGGQEPADRVGGRWGETLVIDITGAPAEECEGFL
jgi:hypothetical protein